MWPCRHLVLGPVKTGPNHENHTKRHKEVQLPGHCMVWLKVGSSPPQVYSPKQSGSVFLAGDFEVPSCPQTQKPRHPEQRAYLKCEDRSQTQGKSSGLLRVMQSPQVFPQRARLLLAQRAGGWGGGQGRAGGLAETHPHLLLAGLCNVTLVWRPGDTARSRCRQVPQVPQNWGTQLPSTQERGGLMNSLDQAGEEILWKLME